MPTAEFHSLPLLYGILLCVYNTISMLLQGYLGFLEGSGGEEFACNAGDLGSIPGSGRSLEKEMAPHSSILAWEISRTGDPGGLQFMGLQGVGQNWVNNTHTHTHTHTGVFGLFSDILLLQTLWLLWTVFKRDSTNLAFYQWVQALDIAHGTFWFVNFASLVGTKGISHRSSCKVPRSLKEVEHFIYLLANRFFLPWLAG